MVLGIIWIILQEVGTKKIDPLTLQGGKIIWWGGSICNARDAFILESSRQFHTKGIANQSTDHLVCRLVDWLVDCLASAPPPLLVIEPVQRFPSEMGRHVQSWWAKFGVTQSLQNYSALWVAIFSQNQCRIGGYLVADFWFEKPFHFPPFVPKEPIFFCFQFLTTWVSTSNPPSVLNIFLFHSICMWHGLLHNPSDKSMECLSQEWQKQGIQAIVTIMPSLSEQVHEVASSSPGLKHFHYKLGLWLLFVADSVQLQIGHALQLESNFGIYFGTTSGSFQPQWPLPHIFTQIWANLNIIWVYHWRSVISFLIGIFVESFSIFFSSARAFFIFCGIKAKALETLRLKMHLPLHCFVVDLSFLAWNEVVRYVDRQITEMAIKFAAHFW